VVAGDVLKVDLEALLDREDRPLRAIGNLPYNVSSAILFRLLAVHDGGRRISDATLMLQREVADRLAASPGTADYGALTLQTALHADIERLMVLPPGAFRPRPKVTSAVVRLRFRPATDDVGDAALFERLVRGMFTLRRKMLVNALAPVLPAGVEASAVLAEAGIPPERRPETLTAAEAARLSRSVLYFSRKSLSPPEFGALPGAPRA
jgi:16S rRNA (adenine1518-N6/adenine1519-N6)-dimethyltransferase